MPGGSQPGVDTPLLVVCALDSFKGSLSSLAAGRAVATGVSRAVAAKQAPQTDVLVVPVADGGEGTLAALVAAPGVPGTDLELVEAQVTGATGDPQLAQYATWIEQGHRKVLVEAAQVVGLGQVAVDSSLPKRANSYGLGELLRQVAALPDVDQVLVSLGGTATTDGGTGILQALGASLFDKQGRTLGQDANALWDFFALDVEELWWPQDVSLTVLTDVNNPLVGPKGAARVFGPQKGATKAQVEHLEQQMQKWAAALQNKLGLESDLEVASVPGAGAAGGIGGALAALGGRIEPGFETLAQLIGLEESLTGADLVITGEGAIDAQSAFGKTPVGVARLARSAGAVVVALAGQVRFPLGEVGELFDAVFGIHQELLPLSQAMDAQVTTLALADTAEQVTNLFLAKFQ